jgi:uncharacterized membrane protein YagU involved in acid resistance
MIVTSAAQGRDVWYVVKGAAVPFVHARAIEPGFDLPVVALGLATHLAISVAWAIPFALLVYGLSRIATLGAGVAWGFVVWIGMYYVVLPIVGLSAMRHDAPVGRAIFFHLVYSITMTLALMLYQRSVYGARKHRQRLPWASGAR